MFFSVPGIDSTTEEVFKLLRLHYVDVLAYLREKENYEGTNMSPEDKEKGRLMFSETVECKFISICNDKSKYAVNMSNFHTVSLC